MKGDDSKLSDEIIVGEYMPGDEEKIIGLLQEVYGDWPRVDLECTALERWTWKYPENQHGKYIVKVAKHSHRVVGVSQQYGVRVKVGGEMVDWGYTGDMAVHPDYRRRGISNRLIEHDVKLRLEKDTPSRYFVTRNPYLIKSYSERFHEFPFSVTVLIHVKDIDKQLQAIPVDNPSLMKMGYTVVKQLQDIKNVIRGSRVDPEVKVVKVERFGDQIDVFWDKVRDDYDFIIERKRGYLDWRYCDRRAGDFDVKLALDGSEVIGYCVNRVNRYRREYPIGFVVDLLTLKGREDAADALLSNAMKYFEDNEVNTVLAACTKRHPLWTRFQRQGFIDTRIDFKMYYKSPEKQYECLRDPKLRAHFMFGDIDSLPVEVSIKT